MSNLRYQTLEQLQQTKADCQNWMRKLEASIKRKKSELSGQSIRLQWIDHYIKEKKKVPKQWDDYSI